MTLLNPARRLFLHDVRITGAHKIADHAKFVFVRDGVRLYELAPLGAQIGGFEEVHLLARGGERNHRVKRAVRDEEPLAHRHRRQFAHKLLFVKASIHIPMTLASKRLLSHIRNGL